jgi:hypothetical protein
MAETRSEPDGRTEHIQEAATMALYVSICLLAALAAVRERADAGHVDVLRLVWGTTLGLALAHWFAFRLSGGGPGEERPQRSLTPRRSGDLAPTGGRRGEEKSGQVLHCVSGPSKVQYTCSTYLPHPTPRTCSPRTPARWATGPGGCRPGGTGSRPRRPSC